MGHLTNLCHEAVKKYWSLGMQSLGEPERSRVVTFIGGRKELMSSEGRKFTQLFLKVASSLFL